MPGRGSFAFVVLFAVVMAVCVAAGLLTVPAAKGEEGPEFLGAKTCKMCHLNLHADWSEKKHSKAFAALTAKQVAIGKDEQGRACVQCHVTGFGRPQGWVSEEETPELKSVGCEACHGPGGDHPGTMMEAGDEEEIADKKISRNVSCSPCHNPHLSHKKLYGAK